MTPSLDRIAQRSPVDVDPSLAPGIVMTELQGFRPRPVSARRLHPCCISSRPRNLPVGSAEFNCSSRSSTNPISALHACVRFMASFSCSTPLKRSALVLGSPRNRFPIGNTTTKLREGGVEAHHHVTPTRKVFGKARITRRQRCQSRPASAPPAEEPAEASSASRRLWACTRDESCVRKCVKFQPFRFGLSDRPECGTAAERLRLEIGQVHRGLVAWHHAAGICARGDDGRKRARARGGRLRQRQL